MTRQAGVDKAEGRIGKLLIGVLLAVAASLALAAAVGAQAPPDGSDSGTGAGQGPGGDGGTGDGGNGDGGTGDGDSGDGDDGDDGGDETVDPAEAAIAECASRYGGYNDGFAEQRCRYPGIIWAQTRTTCVVNMVYSKRATGQTRQFNGGSWIMTERVEDYRCTTDWRLVANPSPIADDDLIRPTPPQVSVSIKYRITQWELTTSSGRVHAEETHRERVLDDDDDSDSGSDSGSGGSGSGGSGSGSGS